MLQKYKASFNINNIQGFSHIEKDIFSKDGKIYYLGICFQEKGRDSIITYIIRNSSKTSDFLQDSKTVGNWGGIITFSNSFYQEISTIKKEGTSSVVLKPQNPEVVSFSVKPCLISKDAGDIEVLNPSKIEIERETESSGFLSSKYYIRDIDYAKLELPILDFVSWEDLDIEVEEEEEEVVLDSNLDNTKEIEESIEIKIDKKDKGEEVEVPLEVSNEDVLGLSQETKSSSDESENNEVAEFFNPIEDELEEKGYQFEDVIKGELGITKVYTDERGNTALVRENDFEYQSTGQKQKQNRKETFEISDEIIRSEGGLKLIKDSFGNYKIVDSKKVLKTLNAQDGDNLSRNNVIKLKSYL